MFPKSQADLPLFIVGKDLLQLDVKSNVVELACYTVRMQALSVYAPFR